MNYSHALLALLAATIDSNRATVFAEDDAVEGSGLQKNRKKNKATPVSLISTEPTSWPTWLPTFFEDDDQGNEGKSNQDSIKLDKKSKPSPSTPKPTTKRQNRPTKKPTTSIQQAALVVAVDDIITLPPGTAEAFIGVLENDTGNNLIVRSITSQPSNGACSISLSLSEVVYIPNDPAFVGTDQCTYEACDDEDDCDTAVVRITIGDAPRPPSPTVVPDTPPPMLPPPVPVPPPIPTPPKVTPFPTEDTVLPTMSPPGPTPSGSDGSSGGGGSDGYGKPAYPMSYAYTSKDYLDYFASASEDSWSGPSLGWEGTWISSSGSSSSTHSKSSKSKSSKSSTGSSESGDWGWEKPSEPSWSSKPSGWNKPSGVSWQKPKPLGSKPSWNNAKPMSPSKDSWAPSSKDSWTPPLTWGKPSEPSDDTWQKPSWKIPPSWDDVLDKTSGWQKPVLGLDLAWNSPHSWGSKPSWVGTKPKPTGWALSGSDNSWIAWTPEPPVWEKPKPSWPPPAVWDKRSETSWASSDAGWGGSVSTSSGSWGSGKATKNDNDGWNDDGVSGKSSKRRNLRHESRY
jgi:hypothetical protein